jgi:hypothetical protein
VTNGGKTAKAVFPDDSAEIMWSVISAELTDPALLDEKMAEYADRFAFAKVSDIDEFIRQTYGGTISAIGKAALCGRRHCAHDYPADHPVVYADVGGQRPIRDCRDEGVRFYKLRHSGAVCGAFGYLSWAWAFCSAHYWPTRWRDANGGGDRLFWGGFF